MSPEAGALSACWICRQQHFLIKLGQLALSHPETDDLLDQAARMIGVGLSVPMIAIWTLREEGNALLLRSGVGLQEEVVAEVTIDVGDDSHVSRSLRSAGPLQLDVACEFGSSGDTALLQRHDIVGGLTMVVRSPKQPFGVLCAYHTEPHAFHPQDLEFMQAVAGTLGGALEHRRNEVELRRSQRQLLAGVVRDLVERKGVEEALRRSEERYRALQLQHTELERVAVAGELAGTVAHEVRTPLNALSINAQMLERALRRGGSEDLARAKALVGTLRGEIDRINDLLSDYLQVLRQPTPSKEAPFLLDQAIQDAIRFVEPRAAEEQVKIELELAAASQVIHGDEGRMRQVLLNILLNAIQAMPGGGQLRVSTALTRETISLKINDTGPGISEQQLERIFQPFITTKERGTGLGLAISDRLVKAMGGSIRATSRLGHGACFEVRLPLRGSTD